METAIEQYILETSWSTRATDEVISQSIQGDIPKEMETSIYQNIVSLNYGQVSNKDIFIKFFSLILKDKVSKPIQAISTQIGHIAGIKNSAKAFEWGILLVKNCVDSGLYILKHIDAEWYVCPNYVLDKATRYKLDRLQYLPPMKIMPLRWSDNHSGGWMFENKHLILGSKFTKHNGYQAYDVINKLQEIPWEIDTDTYIHEKNTNRVMNKKKFLRVVKEYLGQPFHFVWRYDSRGRSYSSGYDLNLQSNEYGKSLISMHNKEVITEIPNLYIAIANHAGMDKLTWQERIDWVLQIKDTDKIEWKQPILGRKSIRALKDTGEGKPTGYVMSLDATSSGLQIMAVLSGCKQTGTLVNCIDPTKRYDAYAEVANKMNANLSKPVLTKICKQAAMTHFYNSRATPRDLLSEPELKVFYQVIDHLFPGAKSVMDTINSCWNSKATAHSWTMPDGHVVYVPVVEAVNGNYPDPVLGDIPVRYYHQAPSDNFRSLCPNVIHSIDGYIAREMIRRAPFQLAHVHDCFVFNPNYLQKVSALYREIMAEIAKSNILQDIIRQITGNNTIMLSKFSYDLDQNILNSSYMLS